MAKPRLSSAASRRSAVADSRSRVPAWPWRQGRAGPAPPACRWSGPRRPCRHRGRAALRPACPPACAGRARSAAAPWRRAWAQPSRPAWGGRASGPVSRRIERRCGSCAFTLNMKTVLSRQAGRVTQLISSFPNLARVGCRRRLRQCLLRVLSIDAESYRQVANAYKQTRVSRPCNGAGPAPLVLLRFQAARLFSGSACAKSARSRSRGRDGQQDRLPARGRGGIGRHARFRFWWRKPWGFKSLRPHHPAASRRPAFSLRPALIY